MTALDSLGPAEIRLVMSSFRDALRGHRAAINQLNVYPVPDGDTGTNMTLTIESVVKALDEADAELEATCKAISHGSLMGARGNSGVILSQILRGMAGVLAEADGDGVDGPLVSRALTAAAEAAYQAVMRPVEGTILTVVRESAAAAEATVGAANGDAPVELVSVLEAARVEGGASLDRTPTLLPVLAEAGVVDAGGSGFLLLLDALLHVVDGRDLPEPPEPDDSIEARIAEMHGHSEHESHGIADLRYEVMFFLDAPDESIQGFKEQWAEVGDSIVVVGGDGIWNCHIHSDDIGASIEAAIEVGRPHGIRVTDLLDELGSEVARSGVPADGIVITDADAATTAVVAVATGAGVMRIFGSLGVSGLVVGGQTMNPSTAQLLDAVERVAGDEVVILPNNKNIIPVAQQVDEQTRKTVRVVPTRTVVEGFTSLIHYDPEASADDNASEMQQAIEAVISGEVTQAVRDSSCDLGPIAEGDFMGIGPGGIQALAATAAEAAIELLDLLVTDDHEIVTIIEGDDGTREDTRRISEWLELNRSDVATEIHHGGQPLYPYLFGIE